MAKIMFHIPLLFWLQHKGQTWNDEPEVPVSFCWQEAVDGCFF
jgi:hypothetical protein